MAQTTRELSSSSEPHCPHCNTPLPPQATFCASCGERVVIKPVSFLLQDDADVTSRYRITSLVRRRPYVSLLFAIDTQQARPVAIRDIDITSLDEDGRLRACAIVQQEYDLLRRERIPAVMPVIDLRHSQGHLYLIVGWPLTNHEKTPHLSTLQDVLQSGIGLPDTHISLAWIEQLCLSLDQLHRQHIVLGDLDPQTLIIGNDQYDGDLEILVSWLPPDLRDLLPTPSALNNSSNYSAPEVLLGKPEPRSDIYSLGAVLYILLTGVPPDEATARLHRRLRAPSEVNPRLHSHIDDVVMKATAIESTERFPNAIAMVEAVASLHTRKRPFSKAATPLPPTPVVEATTQSAPIQVQIDTPKPKERTIDDIINTDTVVITPLPHNNLEAWQSLNVVDTPNTPHIVESSPRIVEGAIQRPANNAEATFAPSDNEDEDEDELPLWQFNNSDHALRVHPKATRNLRQRITGILPALSRPQAQRPQPLPEQSNATSSREIALRQPTALAPTTKAPSAPLTNNKPSFIKKLQRVIMGEQKHVTTAAAIIETPLRVQPLQTYTIRIQLMGRDARFSENNNGTSAGGLSALTEGEMVRIEVRSALFQSYAYIVQQATVSIPAAGFAAEVTIPMKPLSNGPSGRRDRLHIFFMDEHRHPLYEKPFVIELFISHLVQPGREGHNVLTIPL